MPDLEDPIAVLDWLVDQFLRYPSKGIEDMLSDAGFGDTTTSTITLVMTLTKGAAQLTLDRRRSRDDPNDPIPFPSAGTVSDD